MLEFEVAHLRAKADDLQEEGERLRQSIYDAQVYLTPFSSLFNDRDAEWKLFTPSAVYRVPMAHEEQVPVILHPV